MIINSKLLQESCADLLSRAAPEKSSATCQLLKQLNVTFELSDGEENDWIFDMAGGAYKYVQFNDQALAVFWSGAFVAWRAFNLASNFEQAIINVISSHPQIYTDPNYDLNRMKNELDAASSSVNFKELGTVLEFVEQVKNTKATTVQDIEWSHNIPMIGTLPADCIESKAASELAHLALSWALLHEIQHLIRQQNGTSSDIRNKAECHQEEFECDEYAFDYLISDISHYVNSDIDTDEYKIIKKRELGIVFALFSMVIAKKGDWGETDTHPDLQSRVNKIIAKLSTIEAKNISKNMFLVLQENDGWENCPSI